MLNRVYFSLGGNKGNRLNYLQEAISLIASKVGEVKQVSSVYETPALGFNGPDFYNCCIEVNTLLNSEKVLYTILNIELDLNRERSLTGEYISRTIDIDVLYFNEEIISTDNLVVPHPRINSRKFVLHPLEDIANLYKCPVSKKTVSSLLQECKDESEVTKLEVSLVTPSLIL